MYASIPTHQHIAYVYALLRALPTFSSTVSTVPRIRLLESNLCRRHYQAVDPSALDLLH